MKTKTVYEIHIRILLVIGVFFLVWGLFLLNDALTIRKNLKNIYDENVDITKLKEGNYVTVDSVKTLGGWHKDMNSYVTSMSIMMAFHKTYNYCAISYNGDEDKYISLVIETKPNKNIDLETDDNGVVLENNDEIFNGSFDFKVVKMDSGHLDFINGQKNELKSENKFKDIEINNAKDIVFYDGIALKAVDYDEERKVLIGAISVLFTALCFILASKPWKIIIKRYEPIYEFNIIYNDEVTENDIAIAAELARSLRLDIVRYEDDYKELKKNIRNNIIAVAVMGVIAYGIRYLIVLYLLTIILFVKLFGSVLKLIFNNDTYFTRKFMRFINREPIRTAIKDRQDKVDRCDKIINEGIYSKEETYYLN